MAISHLSGSVLDSASREVEQSPALRASDDDYGQQLKFLKPALFKNAHFQVRVDS